MPDSLLATGKRQDFDAYDEDFLSKEPSASTSLDLAIHEQITITPMVRFSTGLSNIAEDEYVTWYPLEDETVMSLKAM